MNNNDIIARFSRVCIDDSLLQAIELATGGATCRLRFDFAAILDEADGNASRPQNWVRPASLLFRRVRSIQFDHTYQLNSTVVNDGAVISEHFGYVEFFFELTGGRDPEAFIAKLTIVAEDFEFEPT